ncbi:unnamed protein product [Polarella glacialis]|uniref:Uncharacterized protein n=1 Tax=Polarella glacialis TaxID=89957 RepID=A0A813JRA8_POLGL|nr:unnamed protein product [Polarella glacialis]
MCADPCVLCFATRLTMLLPCNSFQADTRVRFLRSPAPATASGRALVSSVRASKCKNKCGNRRNTSKTPNTIEFQLQRMTRHGVAANVGKKGVPGKHQEM